MKGQIVKSLVLLSILVLASCGKRSAQPLFRGGLSSNNPVGGNPNGSTGGSSSQTSVYTPQLIVTPSSTVSVGTTVTISVANDAGLYNFRMGQTLSGLSFVGSSTNVRQAYITSTVPTTITIFATPVSYSSSAQEGQVTVNFTSSGSTTTTPVSTSPARPRCRISGPYYSQYAYYGSLYSWSGSPQVGDSPLFTVTDLLGEAVQVTNVWTLNSQETARYYYAWDRFTLNVLSAGAKTVFIKGRSFTSGATCEAQLTFTVVGSYANDPVSTNGFCGIYPGNTTPGIFCTAEFRDCYYYNGSTCQYLGVTSSCAARGAFGAEQTCLNAVNRGVCTSW